MTPSAEMEPGTTAARPSRIRRVLRSAWRGIKLAGWLLLLLLVLTAVASVWAGWSTVVRRPPPEPTVNDVTRLNPIPVREILTPTSTEEIAAAVRDHPGPISIGGGRYSMGGQTATTGALQLDLRQFNRILEFDSIGRTITVQTGVRWRQIQERIDSAGLAVRIMQTYSNFTVGGSLSVNVHGRYVGLGPLILSVRSLRVVLADGSVVTAAPAENPEIFYGVIGGYGALGVITEATLELAENVRVKRHDRTMPVAEYRRFFLEQVRGDTTAIFHNADLYPPDYDAVNAVTFNATLDPVTVPDRLIPTDRSYRLNRFLFRVISDWPMGKSFRRYLLDPILFRGEPVTWRNYEASYDVAELEPSSREKSTYVLQEYFVPVDRLEPFVDRMRGIMNRHHVNVINVSVRHARPDPGSLLAWARTEVFAFVVYYKQGTSVQDRERVATWTRELIDAALEQGGTWYLPYQPVATEEQFLRGYPRAPEFFALKQRLDPENKFRNTLWDRYYLPWGNRLAARLAPAIRDSLLASPGYRRDGGQTFLTHPEWYIVYSSEEYAAYLKDHLPTGFPYLSAIGQYWANYREARALTRNRYRFNWGYHVMLWVIGTSYSAELTLKGLYENTAGRFSGWTAGHALSEEDRYAFEVADDYGRFIHVRPWYEYRFFPRLQAVWSEVPWWGPHPIRKWERKLFLTAEYGAKAAYAWLIQAATRAAYDPQAEQMQMVVAGWADSVAAMVPAVKPLAQLDPVHALVGTPRYDGFRDAVLELARREVPLEIEEIAGNREICLTAVVPATWSYSGTYGVVEYDLPLPTDPARTRMTFRVPVQHLLEAVRALESDPAVLIDHIYDY